MHASDDRGKTWQHVGLPGPMQWPQVFTCASGADTVYVIVCLSHMAWLLKESHRRHTMAHPAEGTILIVASSYAAVPVKAKNVSLHHV